MLGSASLRALGDVRETVLAHGQAWWSIGPFGIVDDDGDAVEAALQGAGLTVRRVSGNIT